MRVSFSLGEKDEYAEKDLRQRLTDFQDHPEDVGLNALLFQYGRYLLIADIVLCHLSLLILG